MEKYDVIVIGSGLGALTTATYLSKRLRNVAIFDDGSKKKIKSFNKRIRDKQGNNFSFKYYNYDLGGVHEGDLFFEYLKRCGLHDKFQYSDNDYSVIVSDDNSFIKRYNDIDNFMIYLVRKYPKSRNEIHKLFEDIKRHSKDYEKQKLLRLKNKDHTLPSLLIEWGDLSLQTVLAKYFTNQNLMDEFTLMFDVIGLEENDINAFNYFTKWFDVFIDGAHFLKNSYDDAVKIFNDEITKTKDKVFVERIIDKFVFENNQIKKVIDSDGNEYMASYYVINMRIDHFIDKYVEGNQELKSDFYSKFRSIEDPQFINRLYVGLTKTPKQLGISEHHYLFNGIETENFKLLSLTNYKLIDKKSCKDGNTSLLIEFIDKTSKNKDLAAIVLEKIEQFFPGIIDNISVSRLDNKQEYFGGMASNDYWQSKATNDLFEVNDYAYISPYINAYFIGSWIKPEAGISGMIQIGVEYGDIIDDKIYYGDDDDYFITHDELMNIIAHQYIPGSLGKQEHNVQFFIGKDSYYIRTKRKNYRLYKGVSDISDLIIIATNECLYDLSVGNTTLNKALKTGNLEYVGDKKFLEDVIDAFDMGIETQSNDTYEYVKGRNGIKAMLSMFTLIAIANLLSNYIPYIYISSIFLLIFASLTYYKTKRFSKINSFEYFTISIYIVIFILSFIGLFVKSVDQLLIHYESKYNILIFSIFLLVTWIIDSPTVFEYLKYDYRTDYTRTTLFKKTCGGITFMWGTLFLLISLLSFTLPELYVSLNYYLVVFGIVFTIFYPKYYVESNITS